jgi:hypothetical protein
VAGSGARIFYDKWRSKTSIANQVILVGWPPKTAYNPNRFKLPLLKQLLDGIEKKQIYYRTMEGEEELREAEALVYSGYPNNLSPPLPDDTTTTPNVNEPAAAASSINSSAVAGTPTTNSSAVAIASNPVAASA